MAGPGTTVEVVHLALEEEARHPFLPSVPTYLGDLFRVINQAEGQGFDAVIVGCCSDPGYRSGKRAASIPVVFPLEAGLYLATMLAERISVITPGPLSEVAWIMDSAAHYGLAAKISSVPIAHVPYPPPSDLEWMMANDPSRAAEAVLEAHRQSIVGDVLAQGRVAVEHDGAGALVLACTFWGGTTYGLEAQLDVPVVDPCLAALWLAEVLARRERPAV